MIRRWLLYLLALLGVLAFYIFYYGWVSWYLFWLMLLLPWLSLAVSLPAMLGTRVRWNWQSTARCTRGNAAILRLGRRTACLPSPRCRLSLRVQHLGTGQSVTVPMWLRESQELPLDTSHCGVLRCQLGHGHVYDYLGLFCLPRPLPPERELIVWPVPEVPTPAPHLAGLEYQRWQAKPGGGFAEQHELRAYRPGDPLHSVHWKLTAKTGDLVVREPQQPVRRLVLVTLDLRSDPDWQDRTLDRLCWLSTWLLERGICHEVRYLEPASGVVQRVPVSGSGELDALVERLLRTPRIDAERSLAERSFPDADWRYHITGTEGETAS